MAKTLLNGVNGVLTKTESLDSDGLLTSLEDSARQTWIDNAVSALNETVDDLFDLANEPKPKIAKSASITLVEGQQSYELATDVARLRPEYHFVDRTNSHIIHFTTDPNGHRDVVIGDLERDDTGLPSWTAVNPLQKNYVIMDRKPDSNAAGRVYFYYYEQETDLDDAADEFPFGDTVYRSVIEAATEQYSRRTHREFSIAQYNKWLARAASRLRRIPRRTIWGESAPSHNVTDPFSV